MIIVLHCGYMLVSIIKQNIRLHIIECFGYTGKNLRDSQYDSAQIYWDSVRAIKRASKRVMHVLTRVLYSQRIALRVLTLKTTHERCCMMARDARDHVTMTWTTIFIYFFLGGGGMRGWKTNIFSNWKYVFEKQKSKKVVVSTHNLYESIAQEYLFFSEPLNCYVLIIIINFVILFIYLFTLLNRMVRRQIVVINYIVRRHRCLGRDFSVS